MIEIEIGDHSIKICWFERMLLVEIVSAICLFMAMAINALVIHYYRSKPLGMQTLMDLLYIDFIIYHGGLQFCSCLYTFFPKPMPILPALIVTRIPHFFILALNIQLSVISIGKFVHVYQQHLILDADLTDKEIINRIRFMLIIMIGVTETIAVYNGHAYREFEYLVGECYNGNCDQGQVAGLFILVAIILKGSLSLAIFRKEMQMRRRINDAAQIENGKINGKRKRSKVMKTFLFIAIILAYGICMILLMTQGKGLMDDQDVVRAIGLVSICIVFPVGIVLMKDNYRNHLLKISLLLLKKVKNLMHFVNRVDEEQRARN